MDNTKLLKIKMDNTAPVTPLPLSQNVNGPDGIFQTKNLQLHEA